MNCINELKVDAVYDLHRLRLLRELSHRGTLAAVAQALGYNPSSVSHQLSLLEREAGVPLLEPDGRRVRLTSAAQVLVGHTEAILAELERAEASVAASRTEIAGRVNVATFQTAAHTVLLDAMDQLALAHPSLRVTFTHINAEDAIPALIARDFDLVLSESYPGIPAMRRPGVVTITLAEDPLTLAVRAGSVAERLEDLTDEDWVMEPEGALAREWAVAQCRAAGFEPRVTYESADVHLHLKLAAHGRANAFLPELGVVIPAGLQTQPTGQTRRITASTRTGSNANRAIAAVKDRILDLMKTN